MFLIIIQIFLDKFFFYLYEKIRNLAALLFFHKATNFLIFFSELRISPEIFEYLINFELIKNIL